jgi:hypothetical protein
MNFPRWRTFALVSALLFPLLLAAQTPAKADDSATQFAKLLKPVLIDAMPETLFKNEDNWGHTVMVPVGVKWMGLRAKVMKSPREHGEWKKLIISAQELKRSMDLKIYNVKTIDAEKNSFKVLLTFQMGVYYDQQNWESGVRLWSGSVRARAQVKFELDCESTIRIEVDKNYLPDFLLRLRVTNAKVSYDKLVVEHLNGVGGTAAKLLGDGLHEGMKKLRPSIERDLLDKASKAIVKTADTREIRIGFSGLLKSK